MTESTSNPRAASGAQSDHGLAKSDRGRRYLDPAVIAKLSHLDVRARLVVEGFIAGMHRSPFHGFSVEFAEHRPYMPGDPLKTIDWKVWARSDRYLVKQHTEETNLRCHLLLDLSGSMAFKSERASMSKLEYGQSLAAALAYLMLQQQDAVGAMLFAEHPLRYVPARAVRSHLDVLMKVLGSVEPQGRTNLGPALHELAERVKRRGLIVLISDLMDEPTAVLSGLQHFRHRHHEVIVFHVLDPNERDFPYTDASTFVDMETDERLTTQPWEIARTYREKLTAWTEKYRRQCQEQRIDYVLLDTRSPFDAALLAYLGETDATAVILRIAAGLALVLGITLLLGYMHALGKGPFASLEMQHLRAMKDRADNPAVYDSVGFDYFADLPHRWSVAEYSAIERRAVSLEGYVQRVLRASDGDIHLEIVPVPPPTGELSMYVTAEITPGIARRSDDWAYESLALALRPDFGATTPWEEGPRRARISGWLLYDFQYDDSLGEWSGDFHPPRMTGWEIHPVTAIDLWSDSLGFVEYAR